MAICPNCGAFNEEGKGTVKEIVNAYMPAIIAGAFTLGATAYKQKFGLVTAPVAIATAIYNYADGKKIKCGKCGTQYKI